MRVRVDEPDVLKTSFFEANRLAAGPSAQLKNCSCHETSPSECRGSRTIPAKAAYPKLPALPKAVLAPPATNQNLVPTGQVQLPVAVPLFMTNGWRVPMISIRVCP